MDDNLTELELQCINTLTEAWNCYQQLETLHPDDNTEFRTAIHAAQNIILVRPTLRALAEG